MTIAADLFDTLGPLVGGRAYRSRLPQPTGTNVPVWPAIRFTLVSETNPPDICGTGDEDTDDLVWQIDIFAQSMREVDELAKKVRKAMRDEFPHPNTRQSRRDNDFDLDTKTESTSIDYLISLSSEDVVQEGSFYMEAGYYEPGYYANEMPQGQYMSTGYFVPGYIT
jgi:hypothetical protein